nr:aldehyde dehydrogenase family protein [Acidobacteriota bacterium]
MATEVKIPASRIASTNPATGETLREFECASAAQVNAAVARARAAQPSWMKLAVHQRVRVLRDFQKLLHARKREVSELITREAGKPVVEALLTEVVVVLDAARFCIKNAPGFLQPERVPHANPAMKAKSGRLLRDPWGVVGIISPWNYPFSVPAGETLAALVTGNAVVLKPSEFTPLCALELERLLR